MELAGISRDVPGGKCLYANTSCPPNHEVCPKAVRCAPSPAWILHAPLPIAREQVWESFGGNYRGSGLEERAILGTYW